MQGGYSGFGTDPGYAGGPCLRSSRPDGALISDNDDDSFLFDTESEGGFGGNNTDDIGPEVHIPNEGAQEPNFATDGEGHRRSQRSRDPIDRRDPGANNIMSYPETVWKSDSDGKLERFNLWTF